MSCLRPFFRFLVAFCSLVLFTAYAQDAAWNVSYKKAFAACVEGRYQEARVTLEAALKASNLSAGDPRRVSATEVLAIAYSRLGETAAAANLHLAVLSTADESTDAGKIILTLASNNLGELRVERGQWSEAAPLL